MSDWDVAFYEEVVRAIEARDTGEVVDANACFGKQRFPDRASALRALARMTARKERKWRRGGRLTYSSAWYVAVGIWAARIDYRDPAAS
jgi:hypothetical protein